MSDLKEKIYKMNMELLDFSKKYYNDGKSLVSDQVYDALYQKYKDLVAKYPEWEPKDSILQQVGSLVNDQRFTKVAHRFPMLSLANAFHDADLFRFDQQIKNLLQKNSELEYFLEYKIDGVSISLIYDQGFLSQAITRGDGYIGEDVTHNILKIGNIPRQIPFKKHVEFRGEIFMENSVFQKLNAQGVNLANPRNATAGTLRQLDANIVEKRQLSSFIYMMPNPLDFKLLTQESVLEFIRQQGFNVNKNSRKYLSITTLVESIPDFLKQREKLDYEVDGLVIKLNNLTWYDRIGYTAKFPKAMIAYKFPAEIVETKLLDIFPTIGRTGRVTYNAKLVPVRLAGTIVAAATLHNAQYIIDAKINSGDIVKVKKAGDIIPKVLGLAKKNNHTIWQEATHCPICKQQLLRFELEVDQYCINESCPQIILAKMEHFVSRNALNIEGLSGQKLKKFLDYNLIGDLADIFALPEQEAQIIKLEGYQKKAVSNLSSAINKAKNVSLAKFLFALGIRHVGQKNSQILAKKFRTLDAIQNAKIEEIESIDELGPKVASSLNSFFKRETHIELLTKMFNYGLVIKPVASLTSQLLAQKSFVITGTLSKSRTFYKNLIETHSGNVVGTISAQTNYLLVGEKPGSKLAKAEKLNVKIINEKQLINMIGE